MRRLRYIKHATKGFTIVELVVVVAVIAILATIAILGYGAWRTNLTTTQVKNDLSAMATAMESTRTYSNGYPATLPSTVTQSPHDTLTLSAGSSATSYCIDGVSSDSPTSTYYIASETKDQGPLAGTCATRPVHSAPGVPTGLAVTSTSNVQVSLSWTSVSGASSYSAACATDAVFINGVSSATTSGNTVTIVGLTPNTTYYCHVMAVNAIGQSSWSSFVTTFTVLNGPSGLAVTLASPTQINYSWNAQVGASSYNVQRATDTAFTMGLTTTNVIGTSGSATGLSPTTQYYFRVQSVNSSSNSVFSAYASISAPGASSGLSVNTSSSTQINYSWTATAGAASYNIQRATDSGFTANVVTVNQAGLSGSSTGLSEGTTYYYRVQAVNAAGTGSYSSTANATTTVDAPTGVSAAAGSSTSITVSWSGVPGATSYKIEYSPSSGFSPLYSTTVGSTSTPIGSLSEGQVWYFRVYALVGAVSSGASSAASAITPIDTPSPPSPQFGNSWLSGQYVVVNWTTYCPAGTSAANGNFTSVSWGGGYYYHGFGFTDWWTLGPSGGAGVTYYARYYCAGPNANSAYSSDSAYGVWIHH